MGNATPAIFQNQPGVSVYNSIKNAVHTVTHTVGARVIDPGNLTGSANDSNDGVLQSDGGTGAWLTPAKAFLTELTNISATATPVIELMFNNYQPAASSELAMNGTPLTNRVTVKRHPDFSAQWDMVNVVSYFQLNGGDGKFYFTDMDFINSLRVFRVGENVFSKNNQFHYLKVKPRFVSFTDNDAFIFLESGNDEGEGSAGAVVSHIKINGNGVRDGVGNRFYKAVQAFRAQPVTISNIWAVDIFAAVYYKHANTISEAGVYPVFASSILGEDCDHAFENVGNSIHIMDLIGAGCPPLKISDGVFTNANSRCLYEHITGTVDGFTSVVPDVPTPDVMFETIIRNSVFGGHSTIYDHDFTVPGDGNILTNSIVPAGSSSIAYKERPSDALPDKSDGTLDDFVSVTGQTGLVAGAVDFVGNDGSGIYANLSDYALDPASPGYAQGYGARISNFDLAWFNDPAVKAW